MALTFDEITELLARGKFDSFVGEVESECFDAKDQPYHADDPGKFEMAKDVCAFANASGGYILIGLRTKQSLVHHADEVEKVRVVAQTLVNTTQYVNILDDWCYPAVEGLSVKFHPSEGDATKGLVAIAIPRQREALKPFLIKRSFDGAKQVGTLFGYVERKRDANAPLSLSDLQRALRSGLNFENKIDARFDRIEELISGNRATAQPAAEANDAAQRLEQRIESVLGGGKGGTRA